MKVTGIDPRSRRGDILALFWVGTLGVAIDVVAGGAAAPFDASADTNSVTVTSLPSAYFVVTVFATIPLGTATLGGGRGMDTDDAGGFDVAAG